MLTECFVLIFFFIKTIYCSLQPPQSPKSTFSVRSVSDKKKFFENAMEESQKPSPKPGMNILLLPF